MTMQFLFILIGMLCLVTNSVYYGYITGSRLFESSINVWMNQIYPTKFWPRQAPRHIILLILDYYRMANNNFYSVMFSFITIQWISIPLPPVFTSDSHPHPTTSILMLLNTFPRKQKYFYWNAFSQESAKQQSLGCAMTQAVNRHPFLKKALCSIPGHFIWDYW